MKKQYFKNGDWDIIRNNYFIARYHTQITNRLEYIFDFRSFFYIYPDEIKI